MEQASAKERKEKKRSGGRAAFFKAKEVDKTSGAADKSKYMRFPFVVFVNCDV